MQLLIIVIIIAAIVADSSQKAKGQRKGGAAKPTPDAEPREGQPRQELPRRRENPAPRPPREAGAPWSEGMAALKKVTEKLSGSDKDVEECEYGDANHAYSHEGEKRMAQLDSFLKNGIIDKAEYQVLRRRYQEADAQEEKQ